MAAGTSDLFSGSGSDSSSDFEFKPLTEGLGFNKKADKKADSLKNEIKSTMASANSSANASQSLNSTPPRSSIFPEAAKARKSDAPAAEKRASAPAFEATARAFNAEITKATSREERGGFESGLGSGSTFGSGATNAPSVMSSETSRSASQSISELMASLPPSLDFLDDKQDLTRKSEMPSYSAASFATPIAPLASSGASTGSSSGTSSSSSASRPQIFQPLGREEYKSPLGTGPTVGSVLPAPGTKAGSGVSTSAAIAAPLIGSPSMTSGAAAPANRTGYGARMTDTFNKAFPTAAASVGSRTEKQEAVAEGLVPVAANFSAGLIDAMVVGGISTILLVCIITITHINLVAMLSNASTDLNTQKNLVFLFFAVLQMYMLVSRAFFGASLGEWAFDTQLGTDEQARSLTYPLQVLWRTFFVSLTGVLPLPLLSFAFRRDLGKYISGVQLYRRP